MYRSISLLFVLIILPLLLSAQVSGYLGKRLIGYYELNSTPIVELFTDGNHPVISFKHGVGAEFILSNSLQVGAYVQFQNFTSEAPAFNRINYQHDHYFLVPFQLKLRSLALQVKRYNFRKRGDLAPLGRYTLYEAGYSQMTVADDGTYLPSGREDIATFHSPFVALGIGRSSVYADYLSLDFGVKAGLMITPLSKKWSYETTSSIEGMAYAKWFGNYLLNFYLRIGLMPI